MSPGSYSRGGKKAKIPKFLNTRELCCHGNKIVHSNEGT